MRKWWKRDDGFSLVWLAMLIVVLIGMTGFGTDLGWLYLNSARAQKAVDSAAMAGVVSLPGFPALAALDADRAARANGYDPGGVDTLTVTPVDDNQLHAELRTSVEPFFIKVLGFTQFNITREATAQYVKPVPLGSPDNCFGFDPTGFYCSSSTEDFWAAVSGRYTRKQDGDPYSTTCYTNSGPSNCSAGNGDYARAGSYPGYYYGIEVEPGQTNLQVHVFDARYNGRSGSGDQTGDVRYSGGGGGPGIATTFDLKAVDTTPLDPTDNPSTGCVWNLAPDANNTYRWNWQTLCTIGNPTPGIYVLHIESYNSGAGSNNFSIAATATGGSGNPRVYGINDMSIWSNDYTQGSELFLAEIAPLHAGKKLELQFYDPGDADNNSWYSVLTPFGTVPNCSWTVHNHNGTSQISSGSGPCTWQTTDASQTDPETGGPLRVFNEQWITAIIDLPDDPATMCNTALPADRQCFWKMDLNLSNPTERTTWRVRVIGNPVRLIP